MGRRLSSVAQVAKDVRTALKAQFPGIKFSVRSESFSLGSSIRISWMDGPPEPVVQALADRFADLRRDAATGEILGGGNRFVSVTRHYSELFLRPVIERLCAKHSVSVPKIHAGADGRAYWVGSAVRVEDEYLDTLIHQVLYHLDGRTAEEIAASGSVDEEAPLGIAEPEPPAGGTEQKPSIARGRLDCVRAIRTASNLPLHTQVYFTGDAANRDGYGEIIRIERDRWGEHVLLRMEDGREFSISSHMIATSYAGPNADRFVAAVAYQAYREAQLAAIRAFVQGRRPDGGARL